VILSFMQTFVSLIVIKSGWCAISNSVNVMKPIDRFLCVLHFEAQSFLFVPPGLTSQHSTFCCQMALMCLVQVSERLATVLLQFINLLVFIIEAVCLLFGTNWVFKYKSG
jgi:hypothetical protein